MPYRLVLVILALCAASCAPMANGELARLYNRENDDCLTQMQGRQDFRSFRQKTPSFLLP